MKIFKSIKWRLQIWYGLILVVVLAGFGLTAISLERERQMNWLAGNLEYRFAAVVNALHPHPLPREQMPGDFPPQDVRPDEFHLPLEASTLFDPNDPHHFFFVIFRHGEKFSESTNAWIFFHPNKAGHEPPQFGFTRPLPSGEMVSIGCSDDPELRELKSTAWKLAIAGAVILIFGLAGGGWLVSRAIKPIEDISAAAVKISAGDLSQRINVAEAESELGKLASVLNSTFARLDAAFAQQKQFASDAAHELRTPVSVILTQTQTALSRERTAPEYRETVEACQRAAQRMRKLIGALLELTRLDAGQEQMKRLRFDFSGTVADCVELVKPLAEESGIKMFTELSPLEITGDAERLAQVATNLLTNAIQYNQPNGEVRVKLASQSGLAILTVSDTGNGISREDLPHVFKRFYCGDKSRTGGNTGLGLAISKAIVEAHGGAIEVSSEEDVGTTFTVRLPG
jgi:two-component system OmpR family sensor kinase